MRLKGPLVKRDDFMVSSEVGSIERDEISILGERSCKGLGASLVPSIHQLLIEGPDSCLISRLREAHPAFLLQWILNGQSDGDK